MPDDIKQQRAEVERKLTQAFNSVAPKIMKIDDLVANFDKEDDKYFKWYQVATKLVAEHEVSKLAKRDIPGGAGVYTGTENGRTTTYISSDYMRQMMIKAIESGKADSHLDDVLKVGLATADAMRDSPDHTAEVRSGQIRPKSPG